jgi:hypothetical protein
MEAPSIFSEWSICSLLDNRADTFTMEARICRPIGSNKLPRAKFLLQVTPPKVAAALTNARTFVLFL